MKKYIALLVAVYLFIGCFSNVVMASDITNPNNTTMSTYKNGFTYNSIDETMLEISEKIHEQKILAPTSISTIKIGTNKTFTAATDADTMQDNNWGSPTIQKMAKISSGGWADCAVNVSGKDANGKAWAYLGNVFEVTQNGGITSRDCKLTFKSDGNVDGYLWSTGNPLCGSQVAVWAEIYDMTDNRLVKQFKDWYKQNECGSFSVPLNVSGTVNLKSGHRYSVIMVVYTEAYNYRINNTWADCYDGKYGGKGLEYGSISVVWQ